MTDPYGQNGPTPPQDGQIPFGGQPQNPVPQGPQGQPQNPYAQGQPQNPYGQGPTVPTAYQAAAPTAGSKLAIGAKAAGGMLVRRLIGVALVVVLAFGGFLVWKFTGVGAMKAGDCVVATGSKSDPNVKKVSCTDANAVYQVTAVDTKCDESESSYTETYRGSSTKLCLYYNVSQGDCVKPGTASSVGTKGACAPGTYKVVLVRTDTADENECPDMTEYTVPNTTRNRLICLTKVS